MNVERMFGLRKQAREEFMAGMAKHMEDPAKLAAFQEGFDAGFREMWAIARLHGVEKVQ